MKSVELAGTVVYIKLWSILPRPQTSASGLLYSPYSPTALLYSRVIYTSFGNAVGHNTAPMRTQSDKLSMQRPRLLPILPYFTIHTNLAPCIG